MTSYLVCATQRSGSTLLCEALKGTGAAGRPLEFFEGRAGTGVPPQPLDYLAGIDDPHVTGLLPDAPPPPAPPYSDLRGLSWEEHLARTLRDGRTPNGVFGAKVMWNQLADIAELSGRSPEEPLALLQELLAPTHWVWVRRRDVLRQAVSLWRALQTQTWRDAGGREPTAVYSRAAIAHLTALLADQDAAWGAFFADGGLRPLELVYEDFASDLAGVVDAVLAHLGLEPVPGGGPPSMGRQSDGISDEWAEAYRRGIAVRPHNTPHPLSPRE